MKLGCMLITNNNGTGSRKWDSSRRVYGDNPVPNDFLTICLDSYFASVSAPWPFVVIDDGSHDDSMNILGRYSERIDHLIHNENNIGLTPSMDMAVEILFAEGCDVICRFDADVEFITAGWDRYVLRHMETNRRTAAVGGVQLNPFGGVWAHGDMIVCPNGYTHLLGPDDRVLANSKIFYSPNLTLPDMECDSVMGCLAAFRSSAYKKIGGMRKEFYAVRGQTEDLNLRFLLEGFRCISLGNLYFIHRHVEARPKQAMTDKDEYLQASIEMWKYLWGFDKLNVDLATVYDNWQGTPIVRNLHRTASGETIYLGP